MRHRIVRHRILTLLCCVLRHPDKRIQYASGTSLTRCPCGYIEYAGRAFRVTGGMP